jgi:hypothetical protein
MNKEMNRRRRWQNGMVELYNLLHDIVELIKHSDIQSITAELAK